jgi:hypothetical protein
LFFDRFGRPAIDKLHIAPPGRIHQDTADIGRPVGQWKNTSVFFNLGTKPPFGKKLPDRFGR